MANIKAETALPRQIQIFEDLVSKLEDIELYRKNEEDYKLKLEDLLKNKIDLEFNIKELQSKITTVEFSKAKCNDERISDLKQRLFSAEEKFLRQSLALECALNESKVLQQELKTESLKNLEENRNYQNLEKKYIEQLKMYENENIKLDRIKELSETFVKDKNLLLTKTENLKKCLQILQDTQKSLMLNISCKDNTIDSLSKKLAHMQELQKKHSLEESNLTLKKTSKDELERNLKNEVLSITAEMTQLKKNLDFEKFSHMKTTNHFNNANNIVKVQEDLLSKQRNKSKELTDALTESHNSSTSLASQLYEANQARDSATVSLENTLIKLRQCEEQVLQLESELKELKTNQSKIFEIRLAEEDQLKAARHEIELALALNTELVDAKRLLANENISLTTEVDYLILTVTDKEKLISELTSKLEASEKRVEVLLIKNMDMLDELAILNECALTSTYWAQVRNTDEVCDEISNDENINGKECEAVFNTEAVDQMTITERLQNHEAVEQEISLSANYESDKLLSLPKNLEHVDNQAETYDTRLLNELLFVCQSQNTLLDTNIHDNKEDCIDELDYGSELITVINSSYSKSGESSSERESIAGTPESLIIPQDIKDLIEKFNKKKEMSLNKTRIDQFEENKSFNNDDTNLAENQVSNPHIVMTNTYIDVKATTKNMADNFNEKSNQKENLNVSVNNGMLPVNKTEHNSNDYYDERWNYKDNFSLLKDSTELKATTDVKTAREYANVEYVLSTQRFNFLKTTASFNNNISRPSESNLINKCNEISNKFDKIEDAQTMSNKKMTTTPIIDSNSTPELKNNTSVYEGSKDAVIKSILVSSNVSVSTNKLMAAYSRSISAIYSNAKVNDFMSKKLLGKPSLENISTSESIGFNIAERKITSPVNASSNSFSEIIRQPVDYNTHDKYLQASQSNNQLLDANVNSLVAHVSDFNYSDNYDMSTASLLSSQMAIKRSCELLSEERASYITDVSNIQVRLDYLDVEKKKIKYDI